MIPSSMGRWKLDVRTGSRDLAPYYVGVLDITAITAAGASASATAGRAYSLNSAGRLVPGILATAGANGSPVPYFAWSGLDLNNYPDVQRDRGMPAYDGSVSISDGFYGLPSAAHASAGGFATIQWKHAGELSTTAFDSAETFVVGAPLTVVAATSAQLGNRGLLRNVELATDVIVGYVAPAAKYTGPEGYPVLAFVPTFVAGTTVPDTIEAND